LARNNEKCQLTLYASAPKPMDSGVLKARR